MWECGLKRPLRSVNRENTQSLLMWECGLKRENIKDVNKRTNVTPYVGVWIETQRTYYGRASH